MAPELIEKSYDEKADMWSCGVILYTMLCGYPPFNGANDSEIVEKIKIGHFEFIEADWKGVSSQAKDLIQKLLTLDPKKRISSQDALHHEWFSCTRENTMNLEIFKRITAFNVKLQMS